MKLRRLSVRNFRGIKELDWVVPSGFVCLVGPGDSGKSTIIDAIEFALYPRHSLTFDDSDFYNGDATSPISIEVTLSHISNELVREQKFGLFLRGVNERNIVHDEPEAGDAEAITIRLDVDSSLEPIWALVNERQGEGYSLTSRDRSRLGCERLGTALDWHFTWSRGSLLARLTEKNDEQSRVLAEAGRHARRSIAGGELEALSGAAEQAAKLAKKIGVAATAAFRPMLDPKETSMGAGALALHHGEVPFRRSGLGTRRLLGIALQQAQGHEGALTLVDEVEHSLEPYRLRRLVRSLRPEDSESKDGIAWSGGGGSTILTSHSATVLTELHARDLCVVRRDNKGVLKIAQVSEDLQSCVRANTDAFLCRRVVVCEGRTEIGICRGLDNFRSKQGDCFAFHGATCADAGGCKKVGKTALAFLKLGYEVCALADSDQELDVGVEELSRQGVTVFQWDGKMSTEQRLATDLPRELLDELVQLAFDEWGEDSICAKINNQPSMKAERVAGNPRGWTVDESVLRAAIASAAEGDKSADRARGWFKRIDLGESVGELLAKHFVELTNTDVGRKLGALLDWVCRE